jgi:hypothetical protein
MKKQILFMMFLSLAFVFAGINEVLGQSPASTIAPQELIGCDDYPLHPRPGIPYAYRVDNTENDPSNADDLRYFWWATKNPNFVDTVNVAEAQFNPDTLNKYNVGFPGELLDASSNYGVVSADASADSVVITWSAEILAATQWQANNGTDYLNASPTNKTPTFVAVMAAGTCTNNLQVFELNPTPAFTVDISVIDPDVGTAEAYGDTLSDCVDIVRAAVYNGSTIDMDYGTDTLYFEVIAANFVDKWVPTFQATAGLAGDQDFDIGWAYTLTDAVDGNFIETEVTGQALNTSITANDSIYTNLTNTVDGVSIFVRIVIHNNTYPSLISQTFTLAVDGVDSTSQWDLVNEDCTDPDAADQNDLASYTITPRPDIHDAPGETFTDDDESGNLPDEQIEKNDSN